MLVTVSLVLVIGYW